MNIKECAAWLNANDNVLLLTHLRPDGDTLGGAAALCSALRRVGKSAALYNNPDITPKYMKYVNDYIAGSFEYNCAVAVDVAEAHMLYRRSRSLHRPSPVKLAIRERAAA